MLRVSAAALFLGVGLTKFESDSYWVRLFAEIGFGEWFRYFTGTLQVLGGVVFLVPKAARAAAVLAGSTMIGAIAVHMFALETGIGGAIFPAAILVFIACVALHRPE